MATDKPKEPKFQIQIDRAHYEVFQARCLGPSCVGSRIRHRA